MGAPADPPMTGGYRWLEWTTHDGGSIVRIALNRPAVRNAQHRGLLVELDAALRHAEADDTVRVIILGGNGTAFSSGHDLGSADARAELDPAQPHPSFLVDGGTRSGAERRWLQEYRWYYETTRRWRELRKITIAEVHGAVFAGGLMLAWCCDLIVAAENTRFADVVATRLGMCGTEYFAHPWELGPRRAKDLLLTGDAIEAAEAHRLGMVAKVFPTAELADRTLAYARRIARLPTITALTIKDSVNQTVDAMGFPTALAACMSLHQLCHAHWAEVNPGREPISLQSDDIKRWTVTT